MKRLRQFFFGIAAAAVFLLALLHLFSIPEFPVTFGVSFSPSYAASLDLDWQETYTAMLTDLRPRDIRLAAAWKEIEPTSGTYDFSALDWMMDEAAKRGSHVLLTVGQKAPRWPECYAPDWFDPDDARAKETVLSYIETVVLRYRHHPALAAWQVENEPFIRFRFGECEKFRKAWTVDEVALVRQLDPTKKIVITDSGELGFWWRAARSGDILGTTVYRFVRQPSGREWSYAWLPASWYRLRAYLVGKRGDAFIISELQAEPWFATSGQGQPMADENGFSPERFRAHLSFARHVGAHQAYLWGVEWWYLMKEHGNGRYWDIAKNALAQSY